MGRKISAAAMLIAAITIMFLVPVGLKGLETQTSEKQTSAVTTTETPATTTAPDVTTGEPEVTAAPETETSVTTAEAPAKTTTTVAATTTKKKVTTTKKITTTAAAVTAATSKKTTTTTKATTTPKPATTTTKAKTKPQKPSTQPVSPSGTPVAKHGQLSVKGANIVDKNGKVFQLRGMSTHGLGWFPEAVSKESFKVLRDDWGCNAVRLAMYIEESWGGSESLYLAQPERNTELVDNGVNYCIDLGMYVVIDWHILNPGDPMTHVEDAKKFFGSMAKKYASYPNIIYEICNEPNSGPDWQRVKSYAEQVIPVIRQYDKDAVIICGTPTWSQDIDQAERNRLSDTNTVYAFHFYAATHSGLKSRVIDCYDKGLPILVSEFGTCDASGNSNFNAGETNSWFDLLDQRNIGYFNWSFCNKGETASAFTPGTNMSSVSAGTGQLTDSGKLVREHMRKRAGLS